MSTLNPELLKQLHILTRDGKLNADSNRKLKQVQHLAQLIRPGLERVQKNQAPQPWALADCGAGKSYLGFLLMDSVLQTWPEAHVVAIESRSELVQSSKELAGRIGFERMHFLADSIENSSIQSPVPIRAVAALHACDTATDDAILLGLKKDVDLMALVPCCQAEVARSLEPLSKPSASTLGASDKALIEHPLHRREFGSHLTNVIRSLVLQSNGYRVTVTELVGWEHSLKNELIIAEKVSNREHSVSQRAQQELAELLKRFPVQMKLLKA